jgi:hypothetical protein
MEQSSSYANLEEYDVWNWNIKSCYIDDVITEIKPLDLILFSGNSLISKTIKIIEKGKYGIGNISHVGVVVDHTLFPDLKEMSEYKLYIWESTSSKCNPEESMLETIGSFKNVFGVQIRDLEKVIMCYNNSEGKVFWGKLKNNPLKRKHGETENDHQNRLNVIISKIQDIYIKYGSSSYNFSCINLSASIYPWMRPLRNIKSYINKKIIKYRSRKKKKEYLFCSEFVAIVYKELGVISDVEPKNITPVDFLGITENGISFIFKNIVEVDTKKQL